MKLKLPQRRVWVEPSRDDGFPMDRPASSLLSLTPPAPPMRPHAVRAEWWLGTQVRSCDPPCCLLHQRRPTIDRPSCDDVLGASQVKLLKMVAVWCEGPGRQ